MVLPAQVHVSVLQQEIITFLQPKKGGLYVDCTLGMGGHTAAIFEAVGGDCRVIGLEWDQDAAKLARERLEAYSDRLTIVASSYANLEQELESLGIKAVDGIVADLGVSSLQLDEKSRGFSFQGSDLLDMRMDQQGATTAADLLARLDEEQLADIFFHYGEERQARRIAKFIVADRKKEAILRTDQLAGIVAAAIPLKYHPKKVHVATKVFQALRIAVNRELDNLNTLLQSAERVMAKGSRVCIISFHSLEDRMVKQAFAKSSAYEVITKKPVDATKEEVLVNPRARSARLRVACKV